LVGRISRIRLETLGHDRLQRTIGIRGARVQRHTLAEHVNDLERENLGETRAKRAEVVLREQTDVDGRVAVEPEVVPVVDRVRDCGVIHRGRDDVASSFNEILDRYFRYKGAQRLLEIETAEALRNYPAAF